MSYWDERDARRDGVRDADRSRYPSYERDRWGSDADRAYHRAFEDRRDEILAEERGEGERAAQLRHEHAREEARRQDIEMEEYYRRQQEAMIEEQPPEEEPEPIVVAAAQVQNELLNECAKGALDEV